MADRSDTRSAPQEAFTIRFAVSAPMFNVRPDRLFPWIYVEPPPADQVPGFRMNADGSVRDTRGTPARSFGFGALPVTQMTGYADATRALAQPSLAASPPSPDFLTPSAPPTGFAQVPIGSPYDVRGLKFKPLEDGVPGFNPVENGSGLKRQETPWFNGALATPPDYSAAAPMPTLPSIGHSPRIAPPQLPGWLYNVVTMPVPELSAAFDPLTGRRIVPYEPLSGPIRSYLKTNGNAVGTGDDAPYPHDNSPLPVLDPAKLVSDEPQPSDAAMQPADVNVVPGITAVQHANPQPAVEALTGNAWPQLSMDRWPNGQADEAEPEVPFHSPMLPQPAGVAPAPSAGSVADSNFIPAKADNTEELQPVQGAPLPQDQPERKGPVTPAELPSRPTEQRTEKALPQAIENNRGAIAAQIEELASSIATFGNRIYEDSILKARDDLARLAERLRNDPGETVASILNSFPQTRVEGKFVGGLAAVLTILANAKRGLEFERAVLHALSAESLTSKISKNTTKIAIDGLGRSIPDVLQRGIREIKSGAEINNSVQLRVQAAYAELFRVPLSLIVSPNTQRISESVRKAVKATGGTIQRFDPATGVFTTFQ